MPGRRARPGTLLGPEGTGPWQSSGIVDSALEAPAGHLQQGPVRRFVTDGPIVRRTAAVSAGWRRAQRSGPPAP